MKKTIAFNFIFVLFVLTGLSDKLYGEYLIRVGIYDNPPKVFLDRNQKPAGLFVDLLADRFFYFSLVKDSLLLPTPVIMNPASAYYKSLNKLFDLNIQTDQSLNLILSR